MPPPNFFVVGAPRCGTTALYTYLSQHPRIFMPEVKELHYFSSDFYNIQKIKFRSLTDYLALFSGADERHLAAGDVSPFYMFSRVAIQNIHAFSPQAKLLVSLRNPVDFVHSLHQLQLNLLRENERDFRRAWDLEPQRLKGISVPASARHVELLRYSELGQFGKYLEKIFQVFPREQVKVILLDDWQKDARAVYEDALAFLNVPSDGRVDFLRVNEGFQNRSALLARLLHPPEPLYRFVINFMSLFGGGLMKAVSIAFRRVELANSTRAPRAQLDTQFAEQLRAHFAPDVEKLSHLIERDLSDWLRP